MKSWIRQHGLALRDAALRIAGKPGSFIFNVIVIALALMLPVAGLTLLDNLKPVSRELAVEPEISVFTTIDLPRERAQALAADIKRVAQTNSVAVKLDFIARENALAAMKERAGLSDVVATLGSNPLPDAYVIKLGNAEDAAGARRIDKLAEAIARLPGVETVQLDSAWVKRLAAVLQLAANVLWLLAATLCGVVVAVVFNTIRLQVVTQAEEIDVARLLGATDAFVSRPFYYTGALLGFGAGIVALLGVMAALSVLNVSVGELAQLYGSAFTLSPLAPDAVALLLAASTGLGLLGAALSVRRALSRSN